MTQMSSVFSKDVSGHFEKMSFRVQHFEHLSVTKEKYISMECIDLQMILHPSASPVHSSCSYIVSDTLVGRQRYICYF